MVLARVQGQELLQMPSIFMTPAQLDRAKESLSFWQSKSAPPMQAFALLGCEGGETGFKWLLDQHGHEYTPPGDHGQARGSFQWWPARGGTILQHTHLDVRFGTHLDCLNGAYLEMTAGWSEYRHVWPALMAAKTEWQCQTELVEMYERSKDQGPDVLKRTGLAAYLQHELGAAAADKAQA